MRTDSGTLSPNPINLHGRSDHGLIIWISTFFGTWFGWYYSPLITSDLPNIANLSYFISLTTNKSIRGIIDIAFNDALKVPSSLL